MIEGNRPDCGIYYDITPRLFIMIDYTSTTANFGMDFSEKLEYIIVAYRNGKIEYELFAACTNRMDKCITDSTLENASHLTQDEVNKLIEYFDLKNRTLLSFSG